tara:strand:+ start:186 stop:539 length:354 start_codon:yes stop_codon:yes gene_type:complete
MSIFDSISRNIKNVFVGSHKGEDIKDEWFAPPPHDSMPIVKGSNRYAPPEKLAELETMNPRPEEEVADWFKEEPEEKKTPHHIAYEIATGKNNPFAVGGSENIHDFDSVGGSEEAHK